MYFRGSLMAASKGRLVEDCGLISTVGPRLQELDLPGNPLGLVFGHWGDTVSEEKENTATNDDSPIHPSIM